jgi:8-oxo-dGTP pyrophosphatase MutT (NUDIX family)
MMDQTDSAPIDAGLRELREETGYQGNAAEVIGNVFPNPAIMSNTCFTVLVKNCELKHPTQFDHAEDLITRLVPIAQIPELVATGKILHSLVIVALYHFELWSRRTAV